MNYIDEEILKLKQQKEINRQVAESEEAIQAEINESIYDEKTHIFGKEVHFEERILEDLGISIYMPKEFYLLSTEMKNLFFQYGNPPSHVFIGDDIQYQITFNHTAHEITEEQLPQFRDVAIRMLENVGPKTKIIDKLMYNVKNMTEEDKESPMAVVHFVSAALDQNVYNVQFYMVVDKKVLIAGLSFPSLKKKRLIPLADEIVKSVKILK